MSYSVIPTDKFKKEARRLIKKYPSLRTELADLGMILSANPMTGTPLGHQAYKIRLTVSSKGKGKSGGARVITYIVTEQKEVYLLTIYDKSELASVDNNVLRKIIRNIRP